MSDNPTSKYQTYIYTGMSILMTAAMFVTSSARTKNQKSFVPKFQLVMGGIQTVAAHFLYSSNAAFPLLGFAGHAALQCGSFFYLYSWPKHKTLKPLWYKSLITWPAVWYFASTWFGIPFAAMNPILGLVDVNLQTPFTAISLSLGALGMYHSLVNPTFCGEVVHIDHRVGKSLMIQPSDQEPVLCRVLAHDKMQGEQDSHLNIFQITDPHLGPFMSVKRLKDICQKAVLAVQTGQVDLVFITGDMETVETHDDEFALTRALEPLLAIKGSVYACLGNHDYETYERSKKAFLDNGIKLLEDDQIVVDTKLGPVQIIGSSFTFGGNDVAKKHVERLCEKFKKLEHTKARFMLIHNPSVFSYIPKDEHVCVWSGHLHGGQIGFRRWTILQLLAKSPLLKRMKTEFPDQGLYARGRNQLYAHRGTGHYGFPLRLGVTSEQSLHKVYI